MGELPYSQAEFNKQHRRKIQIKEEPETGSGAGSGDCGDDEDFCNKETPLLKKVNMDSVEGQTVDIQGKSSNDTSFCWNPFGQCSSGDYTRTNLSGVFVCLSILLLQH